jgi:hypothetical protein
VSEEISRTKLSALILSIILLLLTVACAENRAPTPPETESSPLGDSNSPPAENKLNQVARTNQYSPESIRFEHITIEEGLSQNGGNAIIQDSKGFMWFGTQDGLNKYDGYNFTVYKHNPENSASISDNWIWSILEDHQSIHPISARPRRPK